MLHGEEKGKKNVGLVVSKDFFIVSSSNGVTYSIYRTVAIEMFGSK